MSLKSVVCVICSTQAANPVGIGVDGGVDTTNAGRIVGAGATMLVVGSALFKQADLARGDSRSSRRGRDGRFCSEHGVLFLDRARSLCRDRPNGRRLLRELLRVVRGGARRPAADRWMELSRDGTFGCVAAGHRGALRVSQAGEVRRRAGSRTEGRLLSPVRMEFTYEVRRLRDGAVAADGRTVHAALDARGRPCRLPARVREVFA